jgi:hypothetical protein
MGLGYRRDLYLTTHNTHNRQTDILACGWIGIRALSNRAAADRHLRPRGHPDRFNVPYNNT